MNKSVMKCCICNNENIGQFITINNKKYHLCCIEQLQQEVKKQKAQIEKYQKALDETMSEKIDIQNNWNKLKEYLHNQIPTDKTVLTKHIKIFEVLDKMQELEGSDSNE